MRQSQTNMKNIAMDKGSTSFWATGNVKKSLIRLTPGRSTSAAGWRRTLHERDQYDPDNRERF